MSRRPIAFNNGVKTSNSIKKNKVDVGIKTDNYSNNPGGLTWFNGPDSTSQYVIYSDTYSLGMTTLANAKPVCWATGDLTDANILKTINGLPTRHNQAPFTTVSSALAWVAASTIFNIVSGTIADIVTDGLVFNLDASQKGSYPGSGVNWYNMNEGVNGVLVNGPVYNENNGGGMSFDGIDDVVNLTSPLISNEWSLSYWGKFNVEKIKTNQYYQALSSNTGSLLGRNLFEFTYSMTIMSINTDSSGNIYIGGRICEYNDMVKQLIVKLDSSGNIINTFSPNLSVTQTQDVTDIEFDSSNNLYYVGYNIGNLTKINSSTGAIIQQIGTVNASITHSNLVLDETNNKAYISGWFTSIQGVSAQRITRLNLSTMTIDTSFNTTTGFVNTEDVQMMVLQPNGKLIVGGAFTSYKGGTYNRIIRLNSDGSVDTSFNTGSGFNSRVYRNCIALQSDGKVIVGGDFITYNGVSKSKIVRLNSDGSNDQNFSIGTGFNAEVMSIKLLSDGKILVAGTFTTYNGVTSNRIVRLNSNGTKDTTFNSGGVGPNNSVSSIHVQSDGKILVGGIFTTYNGITANQLCRLNSDGTLDNTFSSGTGVLGAYRLNSQVMYKNTPTTFTTQFFYNITKPIGYNWAPFGTASGPLLNKFFNYTITKNSSGLYSQYWNGVLVQTSDLSAATDTSLNVNVIGTMKGDLANISVYNKVLTPSEVLQNYDAQKSKFGL